MLRCSGGKISTAFVTLWHIADGSTQAYGLRIHLEGNPKWELLCDMLEEVEAALPSPAITASDDSLFRGGLREEGLSEAPPGASVVVLTRDDRTVTMLKQYLTVDPTALLRQEFYRLIRLLHCRNCFHFQCQEPRMPVAGTL